MFKEKRLSGEMIYNGRIMQLYKDEVELENGKKKRQRVYPSQRRFERARR